MANYLVVSAIGEDQPGTVERLARTILEYQCNIEDSRMAVLGGTFALIQLVSGRWNNLAKLETALNNLQGSLHLTITTRHTDRSEPNPTHMPYTLDVVSLDRPGIVHQLSGFLAARGINIQDMSTHTYRAAHTAAPMISVRMNIEVPDTVHIAQLREDFLDLCDAENFDGILEPVKAP